MITRISTILFACTIVFLMMAGNAAAADDIRNSRHNLSVNGTWNTTESTTRICVFCHTPHGGNGDAPVPLWNKSLILAGGAGDDGYIREQHGESFMVGDVSLACLQCHDGTQALDTMINAPGSGGWTDSIDGATQGWSFLEFESFGAGAGTGEVSWLGTDLQNDHPIGIAYAEASCADGVCVDATGGEFHMPETAEVGNYEFDNGIKLQARPGADTYESETYTAAEYGSVECNSCHNPHLGNNLESSEDNRSDMFLRVANNINSEICLTCHVK